MTVYAGTQKITMGRDKRQDAIDAQNALRQSGPNSFVQGVQTVMKDGAGTAIENTRGKYGDTSLKTNQVMQGADSNFQQTDAPGNQPLDDLPNQTGSIQTQVSSTNVPQQDPQQMESDALDRRLAMYRKAAGNADASANDRSQTMRA